MCADDPLVTISAADSAIASRISEELSFCVTRVNSHFPLTGSNFFQPA